jgi:PAS domain S-box-containing protein
LGVFWRDISARKEAESRLRESEGRLRFLSRLDDTLRNAGDATAAMRAAAELLARQLDASRCAYADVDVDNDRFVIRSDYSVPGLGSSAGSYRLNDFGSRAAADMRSGRTFAVADVGRELPADDGAETFLSIGISAIVCCPLVKDGRLVAMMAVHHIAPRQWTGVQIALVEAVVERCWSHVERVAAEARLRESEERYRTLFESIESGFCVVEVDDGRSDGRLDYRVIEANPAFHRQTGFPAAIIGRSLRDAVPALEEHWYDAYGRVSRTGRPERFEQGSEHFERWFMSMPFA